MALLQLVLLWNACLISPQSESRVSRVVRLTQQADNAVEGAITMFVALIAIFMLPDFPHNSRGFSAEERQLAQLRMLEDVSAS